MVCNFMYHMRIVLCELIDTKDIVIMQLLKYDNNFSQYCGKK